jgi:glycerate 2-kinase
LYIEAVRVLVAPDKFKGTLSAQAAAEAIARGWQRADPSAVIEAVPMADGGEGTLDAMLAALGGELHRATVSGPLGDPVEAEFGLAPSPEGTLGIVEMARASGLALLSPARRDPTRTTTRGTGELILQACRRGAVRVLVCIGGSATNDAGAGMAQALGVQLVDDRGRDIGPGGAALLSLARIDSGGMDPSVRDAAFVAATDVDNPLVGPSGASAVYGPQKGASEEDVALLDKALGHFAAIVHRDLGIDVRNVPGAGAAGGLGAGLVAFLGARLRPGVEVVIEAVGLAERMERVDLAITAEGTFDEQSLHGKAPAGVLRLAREVGVPAVVLCGQASVHPEGVHIASMADRFGLEAAMGRGPAVLEDLAAEVAEEVRTAGGRRG